MNKTWKTISSKSTYKNRWFSVRHDKVIRPDGQPGTYDVIVKPDFVVVIPIIDGRFCLVRQYRHPVKSDSWEFPAGSLDPGETPLKAAQRELGEETGLTARRFTKLGYLWTACGIASFGFTAFVADGCTIHSSHREGSEADMKAGRFNAEQIDSMIRDGVIKDSDTLAAWHLYDLKTRLSKI